MSIEALLFFVVPEERPPFDVDPIPPSLRNGQAHARFGLFNLDSVPNFNGHFMLSGFDPFGNSTSTWYTNTVGNPPQLRGTTALRVAVFPVGVELMNVDGNGTNVTCDANRAVRQALGSPVFQSSSLSSSSIPTEWADAISRAEFYKSAKADRYRGVRAHLVAEDVRE